MNLVPTLRDLYKQKKLEKERKEYERLKKKI